MLNSYFLVTKYFFYCSPTILPLFCEMCILLSSTCATHIVYEVVVAVTKRCIKNELLSLHIIVCIRIEHCVFIETQNAMQQFPYIYASRKKK